MLERSWATALADARLAPRASRLPARADVRLRRPADARGLPRRHRRRLPPATAMSRAAQGAIDAGNARFWDELCGSALARSLGIADASPESLRRFDAAYLGHYPYLAGYLDRLLRWRAGARDRARLRHPERRGCWRAAPTTRRRHRRGPGRDGAPPVAAGGPGRRRAGRAGLGARAARSRTRSFDSVYTIGCLHHTGDLPRAVERYTACSGPAAPPS